MKQANTRKALSLILCLALVAALALGTAGCSGKDAGSGKTLKNGDTVGTGATQFQLAIGQLDGSEIVVTVKTDKATVGEALLEHGVIEGEEGAYGLYVKTVNGVTADYDTDGTYWAFYIDGEYASTGVDSTPVEPGVSYGLRVEKG